MPANFVNIVEVDPERQQEVIAALEQGTEQIIRHRPGFVSVTLLASVDGTKVINWAQWDSPEDARATMGDPAAAAFAKRIAELGTPSPGIYRVAAEFRAEAVRESAR